MLYARLLYTHFIYMAAFAIFSILPLIKALALHIDFC